mmetsp:Transcript_148488/g.413733  ORF Transcript_148488/g.413733 Transcript_148488/m.413733 type:complete len:215 (-) Transcript_148488:1101-1745(-)
MAVPMASPKSRIASPWKRMSRPQRYKSLCNLHVKWVLAHDSDMHPSAATTLPMEPPQRVRAYCVPMQLPEASTAKPVATPIILIMEPMSSAQSASRSDRACSDSFRLNSALAWQLDTVNAAPCATPAKAEALRDVSLPHWKLHVVHSPAERTAFAAARNNVRMKEAESLAHRASKISRRRSSSAVKLSPLSISRVAFAQSYCTPVVSCKEAAPM